MIDFKTQERIRQATDIVEVLSEFLSLRRAGTNYKCLCPFHQEKTPSFMVSPSKGIFKCFSCGVGGDAVRFLMMHEQMTYPEALRWLARKYNIEIEEKELTQEERAAMSKRESLFVVNNWALDVFEKNLHETEDGRALGMNYLRTRGFRDDIIKKFRLGYGLPDRSAMSEAARRAGHDVERLIDVGLCYKTERGVVRDRFAGRVIFPIQALDGKTVAFGGRVLGSAKDVAKYVNSPESEIYSKRFHLYGLFQSKRAIQQKDCCYLVEGYTDVLAMHQAGIENVVASSGTSLTYEQIRLIRRFTQNLTILYDGDAAGIKASLRGINMLLEEGMKIRCLLLPDGEDPDSFARRYSGDEAAHYVEEHQVDFIRFKADLLMKDVRDDPYRRGQAVTDILGSVALIPDAVVRSYYIRECSGIVGIDERVLIKQTADLRRKHYAEKSGSQPKAGGDGASPVQTTEAGNGAAATVEQATGGSEVVVTKGESSAGGVPPLIGKREWNLMRLLLRGGSKKLHTDGLEGLTVTEFVINELNQDEIELRTPLYRRMLRECSAHAGEEGFDAGAWFVGSEDDEMVQTAVTMLSDKYQLSRAHSEEWGVSNENDWDKQTFLAIVDLKWAIVSVERKELLESLKDRGLSDEERRSRLGRCDELRRLEAELRALIKEYSH